MTLQKKSCRTARTKSSIEREGFLLITTLFVIAVAGILTVGLARHSMNLAISSNETERQLQTKWGTASCQRFAIQNRSSLLAQSYLNPETNQSEEKPIATTYCQFELGNQSFGVRLDDDSSKLSINRAFELGTRQKASGLIRRIANLSNLHVELRPLKKDRRRGSSEQAFESFGQVFAVSERMNLEVGDLIEASKSLTCWSNRLNYKTVPDEVLFESAKLTVGGNIARMLVEFRQSNPEGPFEAAIQQIGPTQMQTQSLNQLLTDSSLAQSVWVVAESKRSRVYTLMVREEFTSSISRSYSFSW